MKKLFNDGLKMLLIMLALSMQFCKPKTDNASTNGTSPPTTTPVTITSGVIGLPNPVIPPDNPTTEEGVLLGKTLFYDPKLSSDGTVSCGTCHLPEKAFSDGRAKSIGIRGQLSLRSSMPLVNLAWVSRFFWDGRVRSLEEQSLHPIQDSREMDNTLDNMVRTVQNDRRYPDLFWRAFGTRVVTAELVGKALAQFERTLVSFNSKYDRYIRGEVALSADEIQGLTLFITHPDPSSGTRGVRGGNCGDCHSVGLFQGRQVDFQGFMNNGIQTTLGSGADLGLQNVTGNAADAGKMRIPTLRNIELTAPYMHAGQLASLEDVMDHYNHPDLFARPNVDLLIKEAVNRRFGTSLQLEANEKGQIIAFLKTLTDTSFVNNPKFRMP